MAFTLDSDINTLDSDINKFRNILNFLYGINASADHSIEQSRAKIKTQVADDTLSRKGSISYHDATGKLIHREREKRYIADLTESPDFEDQFQTWKEQVSQKENPREILSPSSYTERYKVTDDNREKDQLEIARYYISREIGKSIYDILSSQSTNVTSIIDIFNKAVKKVNKKQPLPSEKTKHDHDTFIPETDMNNEFPKINEIVYKEMCTFRYNDSMGMDRIKESYLRNSNLDTTWLCTGLIGSKSYRELAFSFLDYVLSNILIKPIYGFCKTVIYALQTIAKHDCCGKYRPFSSSIPQRNYFLHRPLESLWLEGKNMLLNLFSGRKENTNSKIPNAMVFHEKTQGVTTLSQVVH